MMQGLICIETNDLLLK